MKKISLISIILVILDRIVKIIVKSTLKLNVKNTIIDNFFYLTFCKNEGAAFSILNGKTFLLIIITLIFLYFLYFFIKREKNFNKFVIINYSLLIGGIIGNLIDRIIYGYVIDYFDFKIFNYNFAIFNLADTFIVIGVILLLFNKGSEENGKSNSN